MPSLKQALALALLMTGPLRAGVRTDLPAVLSVDATQAPRHLLHAKLRLAVTPGPLTLLYPKWIAGEHGPNGPIADLTGLSFRAGGKALPWRRDDVDMFAFHLTVPKGAEQLDVELDYLSPHGAESAPFSAGPTSTATLAILPWHLVLLYPEGVPSDALRIQADLTVPAGWRVGTALPPAGAATGDHLRFGTVTLSTLLDSPAIMGLHFRTVDLGGTPSHQAHFTADTEAALDLTAASRQALRDLVAETGALFGARHYAHYDFLVTLSDHIPSDGIEHHQSSDNRMPERAWADPDLLRAFDTGSLLPHEMTHSWCGKFRRPEGLAPGNSHVPLKGELLYVYEGLTTYLGDVLAVRSGLAAGDVFREYVADVAAALDQAPGRAWRPLQDTAIAAQILYPASPSGAGARRGVDFYPEGFLIWLDADTLIREQTGGKRSLDDFCRTFLGGPSGLTDPPVVSTYTFADLVAALNAVAPRDWAGFLRERLDRVGGGAPLDGLVRSGWRLAYGEAPNTSLKDAERQDKTLDLRFSLGLLLKEDGEVIDALPAQAGAIAGLGPGMKLVAVNGRRFTPGRMHEAIHQARGTGRIELLVENDEDFKAVTLAYRDGERYPHLERIPGTADGLAGITAPRR